MATHYDEKVEEEIPGMVYVFALTDEEEDEEMTAVISDVKEFELPDNFIRGEKSGGGVCAYSLLNALKQKGGGGKKKKKKKSSSMITWADVLEHMKEEINDERGLQTYTPTLSTSRPIEVRDEPVRITAASGKGANRALLIGLHYEEEEEDNEDVRLMSCHDDIRKMREFLINEHGFEKQNILALMDGKGRYHEPTKRLILDSLRRLCEISEPGDSIFVHFSGE